MPTDFVARPPYNVVQPGAYSAVNASELTSPPVANNTPYTALVGPCEGGLPTTPLFFSSPGLLLAVLRGGPLYDAARFNLGTGASQVCVVRVGKKLKQGTLTLTSTSGGVKLTSIDSGKWVNGITVEVVAGPIVTLKYTDPSGNVFTEKWTFTGTPTNEEVANAINGLTYGFTASNFVTAVAEEPTKTGLKMAAAAPLTGGEEEAPELAQWEAGFAATENIEPSVMVAVTGEAAIHAKLLEHCQNMSAPTTRHERTAIIGGVKGESPATAIARLAALRSARVQPVYPEVTDFNSKGEVVIWDPFYVAAKVAGMHCALPDPATSLVHAKVPCIGVGVPLSTVQGGAVDQLLLAGFTTLTPAPGGGVWIVDSISASNEAAGTFRDFHKVRSADYVAQYVRRALETKYTGGKTLNGTRAAMGIDAANLLRELKAAKIIRDYKQPTVEPGPTTGAVVTSANSSNVSLPVMLVDTNKFIFITVSLQSPTTTPAGA